MASPASTHAASRRTLLLVGALLSLGSGLVNLVALLIPSWAARRGILQDIFPLEFIHVSRFLLLLIGFGLVVTSMNLLKRKRHAYHAVLALSVGSILFHLMRKEHLGQILTSLVLIVVLVANRRTFTVRSRTPETNGIAALGVAVGVALAYSVAGFWLLDRRDFGIEFRLPDAIRKTFEVMLLLEDPGITPLTRHARWFLESLDVMSFAAVATSLLALFRPTVYRLRIVPRERQTAARLLDAHGRSALDPFKLWADKSVFLAHSRRCFIGFAVGGSTAIALGDPVGPEEEIEPTVVEFLRFCSDADWAVTFHQVLPDFLPMYRRLGLKKLKIGDDAIVDLAGFTLEGKSMKRLRNTVHRLEDLGLRMVRDDPPVPEERIRQAREVSDDWLTIPGRRERRFTVGMFEQHYVQSTPLVSVLDREGSMLAFANIVPSHAKREATIDLMRHRTDAPNGTMDFLFTRLFLDCRERGFKRFNLGMAPMTGFREREEAAAEERAIHFFFQGLNTLFSFQGLKQFKGKYATSWEPRYLVYQNALMLPGIAIALGRVTELRQGRQA